MALSTQDIMDQFAGQAMHAILSNQELLEVVTKMGTQAITYREAVAAVAERSYAIATAMLLERGRRRRDEAEFKFSPDDKLKID